MDFVSNPDLETFRNDWRGNPKDGRRFVEYGPAIDNGLGKVWRYMTSTNPQAAEKRNSSFQLETIQDDISQAGDWICWLGHASFLLQLDGIRFLIDPAFGRLGFLKRKVEVPYQLADFGHIDYLLISHDHRDHADQETVKKFSRKLDFEVLTTLGMESLLRPWLKRRQKVTEAGWYQRYNTPAAHPTVSLMPTQHWCRRYLNDTNRRLWGSFVIEGSKYRIWFGGDSAQSGHFQEIADYFPNLDLALIGIGAYKPAWFMQAAHTSPDQAWEGFITTGARRLLPMHYGTYDLSQEPLGEPLRLISACAKTAGRSQDLTTPRVGEVVHL
jgi:L-ascorbate metabolism protein UlaG (beta-lactamase superfamily)